MSREWQNTAGRLRQRRGRRQIGQHLIVSLPRELLLSRDLLHYGVPSVLRTNSSFGQGPYPCGLRQSLGHRLRQRQWGSG
jgi:hypothetical protein